MYNYGLYSDLPCAPMLQLHPHRRARSRIQCYKCDWIHLCVCTLYITFPIRLTLSRHVSDRDAKKRWAQNVVSSNWSMGGLGGQMLTGVVKNSVGRVFGS
jgi:hypothetical protein